MKVAIIGGGLVGRVASWAVMQAGACPVIYDRMEHAITPRGFVYIHDPIDLPLTPSAVDVACQGNEIEYAQKVYGAGTEASVVSFGKFSGKQLCYDPAQLLGMLNGLQHGMRVDRNFEDLDEILALREEGFEKIIFTLPLNRFVKGNFPSIRGSVGTWPLNEGEVLNNWCVYNSSPDIPWYRSGAMYGYAFREFPKVIAGHQPIVKVLDGDSPPEIPGVLFTGRFGRWSKRALSHDTYYETLKWLSS